MYKTRHSQVFNETFQSFIKTLLISVKSIDHIKCLDNNCEVSFRELYVYELYNFINYLFLRNVSKQTMNYCNRAGKFCDFATKSISRKLEAR